MNSYLFIKILLINNLTLLTNHFQQFPNNQPQQGSKAEKRPKPIELNRTIATQMYSIPLPRLQDNRCYLTSNGLDWVDIPASNRDKIRISLEGRSYSIQAPPSAGPPSFGEGALWTCQIVGAEGKERARLMKRGIQHLGEWEEYAEFETTNSIPLWMIPLGEGGQFLGISSLGFTEGDGKRGSSLAKFRLTDRKTLRFVDIVNLPFEGDSNIFSTRSVQVPGAEGKTASFFMVGANPPILTPSTMIPSHSKRFLALVAASAGVVWTVDLQNGRVRRTCNVFGVESKDLPHLAALKQVILGSAFGPDGDLIIASRDSKLIQAAVQLKSYNSITPEQLQDRRDLNWFNKELPKICWWRLNPATGEFSRIDDSVDFPESVPENFNHANFRFFINPQGWAHGNAFDSRRTVREKEGAEGRSPSQALPKDSPKKPEVPLSH